MWTLWNPGTVQFCKQVLLRCSSFCHDISNQRSGGPLGFERSKQSHQPAESQEAPAATQTPGTGSCPPTRCDPEDCQPWIPEHRGSYITNHITCWNRPCKGIPSSSRDWAFECTPEGVNTTAKAQDFGNVRIGKQATQHRSFSSELADWGRKVLFIFPMSHPALWLDSSTHTHTYTHTHTHTHTKPSPLDTSEFLNLFSRPSLNCCLFHLLAKLVTGLQSPGHKAPQRISPILVTMLPNLLCLHASSQICKQGRQEGSLQSWVTSPGAAPGLWEFSALDVLLPQGLPSASALLASDEVAASTYHSRRLVWGILSSVKLAQVCPLSNRLRRDLQGTWTHMALWFH